MVDRDKTVLLPVDEANLLIMRFLTYFLQVPLYIHLIDFQPRLRLYLALDATEKTWKEDMEKTAASPRHRFSRRFLAQIVQIGVSRVGNHDINLTAFEKTDPAHTATPPNHLKSLLLQIPRSHIHILTLFLTQSDELGVVPVPAATEIEASHPNVIGKGVQGKVGLHPTGTVAVQIQHNVPVELLLVNGQLEANIDSFHSKSLLVPQVGGDERGVVGEPGGPYEHEGKLLADAVGRVLNHVEVVGSFPLGELLGEGRDRYFLGFRFSCHYFYYQGIEIHHPAIQNSYLLSFC